MLAEFDLKYVPLKAVKGRVVSDFLADNPIEEDSVTNMWSFPDENVVHVKDEVWDLYFDGASSSMGYGVGILLILPKGEHVPVSIKLDFLTTNNAAEYEACLLGLRSAISLNIKRLLVHGDSSLVINQVTGSWNIKSNSLVPYQAKIEELEKYFGEIHYVHLPREKNQFANALSKLAALVNIPDHIDSMPLCIADIMFDIATIARYLEMYSMYHPRSMLYTMTSPWPFLTWGIDIIEKVNPSGLGGHCFILVAIDYFTNDNGTHFKAETEVILEKYKIKHHKSSPYRPETNGAVEAANRTLTSILRKMSHNYKDWPFKIPFALWGYRTSIRIATGATPYYLVYGMEAVQPIELEVPSLRILLESQVPEADWVQARYDSLVLLDERRLNALYQVQLYNKRIERAFNKKVKPRKIKEGDYLLKSVRALLPVDPRGKFKPNWTDPYLVKRILTGGAVQLTDLDGNDFLNPTNMDQLKKYYP
ncbi:uncharacterized protein LOC141590363 [Silene latifolia]|uniref:uncharacterized protein LOC141590363 n=1 Tax=Silene latifolia TaxID=37657 RepID=UPI003D775238